MLHNFTIDHQLNHRTIRKFKDQPLTEEQLTTLFEVARQTSSSEFIQQMTIIRVTDPQKRAAIRAVSTQPYVGAEGELLMFITDLHRNELIRHHQGNFDDRRIEKTEMFLQAYEDTVLAVQNVLNAAESMGLGGVILGSIQNEPAKIIKTLNMPKHTFPTLGLQLGVPDQKPQLKPRLPLDKIVFENEYQDIDPASLKDYDQIVNTYYDLRDANRRIDTFTDQVNGPKLNGTPQVRDQIAQVLHDQKLCLDL